MVCILASDSWTNLYVEEIIISNYNFTFFFQNGRLCFDGSVNFFMEFTLFAVQGLLGLNILLHEKHQKKDIIFIGLFSLHMKRAIK